jgi:hypothetical protein
MACALVCTQRYPAFLTSRTECCFDMKMSDGTPAESFAAVLHSGNPSHMPADQALPEGTAKTPRMPSAVCLAIVSMSNSLMFGHKLVSDFMYVRASGGAKAA